MTPEYTVYIGTYTGSVNSLIGITPQKTNLYHFV